VRRLGGLIVGVAFLLAACSNGGSGDESRPSTAPPTSPAPTTTTSSTAAAGTTTTLAPDLAAASVALEQVASGLESPVAIAWRGDDDARPYVAEQRGTVRVVAPNGEAAGDPVLRVGVSGGNEQGLLGLAFSADGTKLYVNYTDPDGDTHVDEYTMRGDVAEPSTRRKLLFQPQPFANHNGGHLILGPDGMLYVGLGDGGGGGDPNNNAQSLGTWLGKILRIDPRPADGAPYTVPADNPFVGRRGARPEIWMYGLRNPWRFSFDRQTGDLWVGDVGQNRFEEIDYSPAGDTGINWGWNLREGAHEFRGDQPAGGRDPIVETPTGNGNCAIVGGYVYRGSAIPLLRGAYVFGDNCNPALTGVVQRDGRATTQRTIGEVENLTTFGEDPQGELYAVSREGTVYRVVAE
jgi:glucose/arabinose dehydrogenase